MKGRIFERKGRILFNKGLLGLITVPPPPTVEHIFLLFNPENYVDKIAFTPEDFQTIRYLPLKNKSVPLMSMARSTPEKNYDSTSEAFHEY